MKKTLFLYTKSYPFGKGESFLENEITYLSKAFDMVYIFPRNNSGEKRELPSNVGVINLNPKSKKYSKFGFVLSSFLLFLFVLNHEVFKKKSTFFPYLKNIRVYRSYFYQQHIYAKEVFEFLSQVGPSKKIIHYSFWTDDWALSLSILKKQKKIESKIVSRVHGFDLFEERHKNNLIPFRFFTFKQISKIIAVSEAGYKYLIEKYPKYKGKFSLYRLGVCDNGQGVFNPGKEFVLVSCANLIPLKRVEFIPDIIELLDFPVRWIHFGDGPVMPILVDKIKGLDSSEVLLKGHMPNSEILSFYRKNHVDLVILLSETEGGVPVSLQEAVSFGIPVLGTNVGGVPEVVNKQTGFLIEKDFKVQEVADIISASKNSRFNSIEGRSAIRKFWQEEHLNPEQNYLSFIEGVLLDNVMCRIDQT